MTDTIEKGSKQQYAIYADNIDKWKKLCDREWRTDKELAIQVVENGYILPILDIKKDGNCIGGVTDAKFNFIAGLFRNAPNDVENPGYYGVAQSYIPRVEDIQQIGIDCVWGGGTLRSFWALYFGKHGTTMVLYPNY